MSITQKKWFKPFVGIMLFGMIGAATMDGEGTEDSSLNDEPGEDEYTCGGCHKNFKKDKMVWFHFAGHCDFAMNTDDAYDGSYYYCSEKCCESDN